MSIFCSLGNLFQKSIRTTSAAIICLAVWTSLASNEAGAELLSAKRGFADTGASYPYMQALNAGWYYRWGPDKADIGNYEAEFVPMFWGGFQANQPTIDTIIDYGDIEWVLGFNEPEREDQANMTVGQAISAWQTLSNGFAGTDIKLISPGVADTGGPDGGQAWLADFMSQANSQGLQVDAVAFHWYGASTPNDPIGAANSFLSRVDSYHNSYGLPVWITEFAIHDWGGNYSDEEIRAANAAFLDYVVPRLESRSHVAGYAWYNWFGDSALVEGNPLTPTNVGIPYVGTITSGEVHDFGGTDLGEHVAYLGGGELTDGGEPGTVRYINALQNTSTISGSTDWQLTRGNWIRVQPGAVLRKAGANEVHARFSRITNNGVIDITEGELHFDSSLVEGTGKLRVRSGARLGLTPRNETPAPINYEVELDGGTINVYEHGEAVATNGAIVSGAGSLQGHLTAQDGSIIRVGGAGISQASRFLIDDFESYPTGLVRDVADPPWTAHGGTSFAVIEDYSQNKVLSYGWASEFRGTSRDLPEEAIMENGQTATLFFRVNSKTDDPDHNVGLADVANTGTVDFSNFEAQVRFREDTSPGTFALDARDGDNFSATLADGLAPNSWYNLWMVVDQSTDTYDVYMNTGDNDATPRQRLNSAPLEFRNGTGDSLQKILALAGPAEVDNALRVDDLVFQSGFDLSNPLSGLEPGFVLNPETLNLLGDLGLESGSLLELDIYDPENFDRLVVSGNLAAGGTLEVLLDGEASALAAGDTFDLLDFASVSGSFANLQLPALSSGLYWNTSGLYTEGLLAVDTLLPGDFDQDGDVDGADFLVWQRGDSPNGPGPTDLADWQANYGAVSELAAEPAAVPEPSSMLLILACLPAVRFRARHRL